MLAIVADKVEPSLAHVDTLIDEREVRFLRPTYEFVEVLPWANARQRRGCGYNHCDDNLDVRQTRAARLHVGRSHSAEDA